MIELWNYDKLWNVIILVANYWYVIELSNYLYLLKVPLYTTGPLEGQLSWAIIDEVWYFRATEHC